MTMFIPLTENVVPSSAVKTPSFTTGLSKEYMLHILSFGCTNVPFLFFVLWDVPDASFVAAVVAADAAALPPLRPRD